MLPLLHYLFLLLIVILTWLEFFRINRERKLRQLVEFDLVYPPLPELIIAILITICAICAAAASPLG